MPRFSDDDVVDFLVTEAAVAWDSMEREREQKEADKAQKQKQFRESHRDFAPGKG